MLQLFQSLNHDDCEEILSSRKKEKEEEKLMRDLVKFITFFSLLPATHTVSRRERAAKRMEKSFLRFIIASVWSVHSSVFPKKLLSYQTLHHLRCC